MVISENYYNRVGITVSPKMRAFFLLIAGVFICEGYHHRNHPKSKLQTIKITTGVANYTVKKELSHNEAVATISAIDITNSDIFDTNFSESSAKQSGINAENRAFNTNLQSALDDIAPGQYRHSVPESIMYPDNSYQDYYRDHAPSKTKDRNETVKSKANVLFQVIDVGKFLKRHNHSARFVLFSLLYGVAGIGTIIIMWCLAKTILRKKKRHTQYMLLTKRDMDFPLGGGGI